MSSPVLKHFVDQPAEWSGISRCLIVRGWCFAAGNDAVTGVRLRAGDLTFDGVVGLPRPDVQAALPDAPHPNTGFEIRGVLPGGRSQILIEVQLAPGTWIPLVERAVAARRQLVPLWMGGGHWTELMYFQMPAHMAHRPRPVRYEHFPTRRQSRELPRFSIVTPSFQQVRFLEETIRSVLDQTGVAVDYVVQDGGSSDGSAALIENYRARLFAAESAPDHGQADAIVRGFAKTSGRPDDIMAWINSDDFFAPGALEFVARHFAEHPEIDVLYGHRIVVDEQSREIARWFLPAHDDAVLKLNDFVPQETLFWRRRIWERVGGIDPSFRFAMDWDLLLRFAEAGAMIVRVPHFLGCFRVHPVQKTSAAMHDVGKREIRLLRTRSQGREVSDTALETDPRLLRYLRKSARLEFLWRLGIRGR